MSDDNVPIFQLDQKIAGLIAWATRKNRQDLNSERQLALTTLIGRGALKYSVAACRMSMLNQEKLSEKFGFSLDWVQWSDPSATPLTTERERRDSAKAFIDRFVRKDEFGARLTIKVSNPTNHLQRRFADFRFDVPLSFSPVEDRSGIPLVLSLSFDGRGWPVHFEQTREAMTVGLREVDLQLEHHRDGARIDAQSITCRSEGEGNFVATLNGLPPPWWIIAIVQNGENCLRGRRLPNDGEDCLCIDFNAGDVITAKMTARIDDCFISTNGAPFEGASETKLRFIEHLTKLSALNGPDVTLAEQTLTVVEFND